MDENERMARRIIYAVRTLCSDKRLGGPVLPHNIWEHYLEFGVYAVEATIRRHMARLAEEGRLIRCGERKGYVLPNWRTGVYDRDALRFPVEREHYADWLDVS